MKSVVFNIFGPIIKAETVRTVNSQTIVTVEIMTEP